MLIWTLSRRCGGPETWTFYLQRLIMASCKSFMGWRK